MCFSEDLSLGLRAAAGGAVAPEARRRPEVNHLRSEVCFAFIGASRRKGRPFMSRFTLISERLIHIKNPHHCYLLRLQ